MRKHFDLKQVLYLLIIFGLTGCASSKKGRVIEEKPPGLIGRFVENTTSRYNAYYNSELLYNKSMIAGETGYKDDFNNLLPASVQDAISESGSATGNMDQIIMKTATMIEKKPYAKWVDDHFLLNGIAQYIKGDYDMAERIFKYTSTEYKFGVNNDRVSVRQKERGISEAKRRKLEAKEKIKAQQAEKEKIENEKQREADKRKEKADIKKKKNKVLSRDEQFKAKQAARKQGRDVTTEEIVKEIKERNDLDDKEKDVKVKELSDKDREIIATAPTLKNNQNGSKESKIGHHLAAKDATLWLAKTYITTEDFIAAQAVLTDINEDAYFPERLNTEYYLTYADMHIRLNNYPKAIEYVQLAIDSTPRREKGRLYYLKGQLYKDIGENALAEQAFQTVEKYHPYYDMIYEAKKQNFDQALKDGRFEDPEYIDVLKKMIRDSKNDDFRDEVYYYLGEAYNIQNQTGKALESFEKSLEYITNNPTQQVKTYSALGDSYYSLKDYKKAQPAYASALQAMDKNAVDYRKTVVLSSALEIINTNLEVVHVQDSLLQLSELPKDKQLEIVTNKANKKLRKKFQDKLNQQNEEFGKDNSQLNAINDNNNNRDVDNGFYFYDMQQSVIGYSKFKEIWGNRPNLDGWRRQDFLNKSPSRLIQANQSDETEEEPLFEDDLIAKYLSEIPNSPEQKEVAYTQLNDAYLVIGEQFITQLGDYEQGELYLKKLLDSRRNTNQIESANKLLRIANQLENNQAPTEPLFVEEVPKNETPEVEANQDEISDLYTQTYSCYEEGDYERVLELVSQAEKFQNNNFGDKFAFIGAMSKGYLEGGDALKTELNTFTRKYPQSPLKEKALALIIEK